MGGSDPGGRRLLHQPYGPGTREENGSCTGATDRKAGEEERTESIQSNEGQGSRKVAKPLAESASGGGTVRADRPRNSYNACSHQ